MGRGFISFLFLVLLLPLMVVQTTLAPRPTLPSGSEALSLLTARTELENTTQAIIRFHLHDGLRHQIPPPTIRTRINSELFAYYQRASLNARAPMQIEFGFMAWDTTHTLALLDRNHMLPLSVEEIDARSHVFVLPLSADEWYGEYAYTGGLLGGEAVTGKVRGVRSATLFALPPGSRVCSTSFLENIPCGGT